MKVNCEATVFGGDAGWIAQETIIFIFNFQNICIQLVKQSGNKAANYLTHLFGFPSWLHDQLGVCRVSFVLMKYVLNFGKKSNL